MAVGRASPALIGNAIETWQYTDVYFQWNPVVKRSCGSRWGVQPCQRLVFREGGAIHRRGKKARRLPVRWRQTTGFHRGTVSDASVRCPCQSAVGEAATPMRPDNTTIVHETAPCRPAARKFEIGVPELFYDRIRGIGRARLPPSRNWACRPSARLGRSLALPLL